MKLIKVICIIIIFKTSHSMNFIRNLRETWKIYKIVKQSNFDQAKIMRHLKEEHEQHIDRLKIVYSGERTQLKEKLLGRRKSFFSKFFDKNDAPGGRGSLGGPV